MSIKIVVMLNISCGLVRAQIDKGTKPSKKTKKKLEGYTYKKERVLVTMV